RYCTDGAAAGESRRGSEFLFDTEQLVVFGDAIGPARRTGFNLPRGGADCEVRDGGVLGLARTMRNNGAVVRVLRHFHRVERFSDRTDLIQLDEERVADALRDAALEDFGIRDEHVVADELDAGPKYARQHLPAVPVAFGQAVFDRNDRVFAQPILVEPDHLFRGAIWLARFLEGVRAGAGPEL